MITKTMINDHQTNRFYVLFFIFCKTLTFSNFCLASLMTFINSSFFELANDFEIVVEIWPPLFPTAPPLAVPSTECFVLKLLRPDEKINTLQNQMSESESCQLKQFFYLHLPIGQDRRAPTVEMLSSVDFRCCHQMLKPVIVRHYHRSVSMSHLHHPTYPFPVD